MALLSRGEVIECIRNFIRTDYKRALVRSYCLEKGKDETDIEHFLIAISYVPNLLDDLSRYIIDIKKRELELIFIYKNNQLISVQ